MLKSKKKNDIILILSVLVVSIVLLSIYVFSAKTGEYAVVRLDGEEINRYPLSQNTETEILSEDGGINVLKIEDGKVYFSSANCRDKICVSHSKISHNGESIICLPHKLVVSVEGHK